MFISIRPVIDTFERQNLVISEFTKEHFKEIRGKTNYVECFTTHVSVSKKLNSYFFVKGLKSVFKHVFLLS